VTLPTPNQPLRLEQLIFALRELNMDDAQIARALRGKVTQTSFKAKP
jgi:hypothetical protein